MSNLKSKILNLEELNKIIIRDLEMSNDKLSNATMSLYLRQLVRLYRAGKDSLQWDPEEFADRIRYPNKFAKCKNSDVISLLMRLCKNKESLVSSLNALCKMVKNRFKETFCYYNAIRKVISKQYKADKLDNELTPEEQKKCTNVTYNGKPMSMNIIRHIEESHLIQLPTYAKLTNREKHDLHAKLLHSTFAANTSYNKIQNQTTTQKTVEEIPDFGFKYEPEPPSPVKSKTRSKGCRERIFHGDFKPSGSDKHIEIEIFEN
ncbi:hypothetical protein THRCLA_21091 [Thraustotheca clavata]|uniref:Uncharacterized protein n=1 Tax=Thraustotheca clavata TaxID=74557 RepID=A0A1W0A0B8_9STRA|nr:hypothetical protein THRCLA_21091 [Thraustotheca clavata]